MNLLFLIPIYYPSINLSCSLVEVNFFNLIHSPEVQSFVRNMQDPNSKGNLFDPSLYDLVNLQKQNQSHDHKEFLARPFVKRLRRGFA